MKFSRILILTDDSRASQSLVQTGYEWAADMGAQVFLAHVIDEALVMGDVDAGIFPDEALRRMLVHAEKMLNDFRDDYSKGIETGILMPVGEMRKVIPKMIGETGTDLIIMGAHSRNLLERLVGDDADESVLRVSTVPVLVVPLNKTSV
jgi:nucleotide-binding universal stress UspA family protein